MPDPAIRLRDVRFRWSRSSELVLDIAAFDVATGERVFVQGPSGSGKTTLLSLLGGFVSPEEGSATVLGSDITRLAAARRDAFRADRMGFIFQMFNLVPYLSLVENVVLPCRFSKVRRHRVLERSSTVEHEARRLLARMGLAEQGLAGRSVAQLSVGQQQRVAAARSLIGAPGLVIADEPTSSLDAGARRTFLDLLFGEIEESGATLVFVSHDDALATAFDRRVVLSDINRTDSQRSSCRS